MTKRATLILAAICAAMLAFIVLYEQNTLSSGELEARRGQVLDRFVRGRVHGITLRRGDEVVVTLVRDQEVEETLDTFDVGSWRLTAPVTGDADSDAIDGLLLACEGLSARRTLEAPSAEDRERFGLDAPRMELTLEVADETQIVRVGAEDEALGATYLEVVGTNRVHLVGRDFVEALDHDTDHFRSKELVAELSTRDVTALVLETREGDATSRADLELREHRWVASSPFQGWARKSTIDAILDAMIDARVARFVRDGGDALVAAPRATVTVTARERDDQGRDTGRLRPTTFVIGAPCPAPAEGDAPTESDGVELLAARAGDGPVVCVAAAGLQAILGAQALLRETRLVAATEDQVERLLLATRGESTREIELRRADGDWELIEGELTRPADEAAVGEYLRALRAQEAESFEPATDENLAARGLATPAVRVRLHRSDVEGLVDTIDVGDEDTVGVWVRRSDEAVLCRYVGETAALLAASSLRFRARDLVGREPDDVLSLSITRGAVEERLSTDNGSWRIEAPHALAADRIATRDLVRALATLRAVRWAADTATADHGLDSPRVRVHLSLREGTTATTEEDEHDHGDDEDDDTPDAGPVTPLPTSIDLLVGAATEGGAFARLDGEPAVFVIGTDVVDALVRPLVDRELIALDTSQATRISLTTSSGTVTIDRLDGRWIAGDAPAAPDATDAFIERLRSLRARTVTSYGAGASAAAITVEVTSPAGTRRLEISSPSGEGEAATASARLSDVPAEFVIAADTAAALASYRP